MNISIEKKKYTYSKVVSTTSSPDEIKGGIYEQFENFGTIEEITCSEPIKHAGSANRGSETYELSLIIEVQKKNFGTLGQFAYHTGWEKQKEMFIS